MKNVGYKISEDKRRGRQFFPGILRWSGGIVVLLLVFTGCGPMYTKPLERAPQTRAERNFRDLWDASCVTLKKYGFPLDRQDRRAGVITTYAVSGGHGLEVLWRKDASNFYQFQENTAQNILRAARVKIRRLPENPDEFDFTVEVRAARTTRPQPQLTDSSDIYKMYVPQLPELRFNDLELRPAGRQERLQGLKSCIVPLGRDEEFAWRIDRSIRARAGIPDRSFRDATGEEPSDESTPPPLPEVSGSPKRTVILAGPLEGPKDVSPASPTTVPETQATSADEETADSTPHGQVENPLRCSLRTADHAEKTPTPVAMIFRLRNAGNTSIRLPQPKHGITLFGRYRRAGDKRWDGAPPPDTFALPTVVELAPGDVLDVPLKFSFDSAGEYEIYYRYSARPGRKTNWSGDLDSNVLKLTITGAK